MKIAEVTMDPTERLNRAIKRAGRNYANGTLTRAEMIATQTRVLRLRERWAWTQARNRRRAKRRDARAAILRLRAVLAARGRLIAYDTEYVNDGPVLQFGVAIWSAGTVTSRTYTVPGFQRFIVVPSTFGRDRIASSAQMRALAARLYRRDAIQIFHNGAADLDKLGLDRCHPDHIDTAFVGHLFAGKSHSPGLRMLCERYGIDTSGHHNAGNDARYTLHLAIAMALDPVWDRPQGHANDWSDRLEAIAKFAPTRFPPYASDDLRRRRRALLKGLRAELAAKK